MNEDAQTQQLPANKVESNYGALPDVSFLGAGASPETTANFYMYCFKVLLCPKRYNHDWGACPYAHYKENARRRDPQQHRYSSCFCPNTARGHCPADLQCPYAHGLFEYWLHPSRFRTQMCKSGQACKRTLCFFAHTAAELREPTSGYRGKRFAGSSSSSSSDLQQQPVKAQLQQQAQGLMFQHRLPIQPAAPQLQPLSSQSVAVVPSNFPETAFPIQQAGNSSAVHRLGTCGALDPAGGYMFQVAQSEQQQPPQLVHMVPATHLQLQQQQQPIQVQIQQHQSQQLQQQILLQVGAGVRADAGQVQLNGSMAVPGMLLQIPSNQTASAADGNNVLMNLNPNLAQPGNHHAALLTGLQAMQLQEAHHQHQHHH